MKHKKIKQETSGVELRINPPLMKRGKLRSSLPSLFPKEIHMFLESHFSGCLES